MGERAVLVELDTLADVLGLDAGLTASILPGVDEIVPAARTILVRFDPARTTATRVRAWVARTELGDSARRDVPDVALDVVYDGADLADTAALLGLREAELIARHVAARWRVAFTGFAPGFAYLAAADWPFHVPRLATPRTRVPAGAVGLAAEFTGAYPRETPGGWRLIATTTATLFDPAASSSVLLTPGARVRFRAERAVAVGAERVVPFSEPGEPTCAVSADGEPMPAASVTIEPTRTASAGGEPTLTVSVTGEPMPAASVTIGPPRTEASRPAIRVDAAVSATVQDLGRAGRARLGISRSGALDRGAVRLANRLLGNADDAATIEIALGGFAATALRDLWIVVTGAWAPLRIDGRPVDPYVPQRWRTGVRLEIGWGGHGARSYLGVRGGMDVSSAADSRSTDTLAGLGPDRIAAGAELAVGAGAPHPIPPLEIAPWGWPADPIEVELGPGPRADEFAPLAHRALVEEVWTVAAQTDRIGMRLDGPVLPRRATGEVPSEGMVPGAMQVPPHGRPVILLADGPVTGGYPVIAVVTDATLDRLAQAGPGTRVRFRRAVVGGVRA